MTVLFLEMGAGQFSSSLMKREGESGVKFFGKMILF